MRLVSLPCITHLLKAFLPYRGTLACSLLAGGLLLFSAEGAAQLQTGRDSAGALWISDQTLPDGVTPAPLELDQAMSLTPERAPAAQSSPGKAAPTISPVTHQRMSRMDLATCQSIDQRYEETRENLTTIERDKASGKLLIPDSGLVTIRQNLASLERLKALCPRTPAGTP